MIALQGTLALPYMVIGSASILLPALGDTCYFCPWKRSCNQKMSNCFNFCATLKFKKRRVPSTFRIFRYSRGKLIFQPKNSNLDKKNSLTLFKGWVFKPTWTQLNVEFGFLKSANSCFIWNSCFIGVYLLYVYSVSLIRYSVWNQTNI